MFFAAYRSSVSDQTAYYLAPAIETEPDINSAGLFRFGIPLTWLVNAIWGDTLCLKSPRYTNLRSQECKSRSHRRLKDTEEEANCNCPAKIFGRRKAGEDQAPDDDADCIVFS